MQLPYLILFIIPILLMNKYGDNLPFIVILSFAEGISGVIGLLDWVYTCASYAKLNKLNTQALKLQEVRTINSEAQEAEQASVVNSVRDSVIQIIDG